MIDLAARLLAAHANGDNCALVDLYTQAADAAGQAEASAFYLTHAMVFALELGDPRADPLRARLIALGREEPLDRTVF